MDREVDHGGYAKSDHHRRCMRNKGCAKSAQVKQFYLEENFYMWR